MATEGEYTEDRVLALIESDLNRTPGGRDILPGLRDLVRKDANRWKAVALLHTQVGLAPVYNDICVRLNPSCDPECIVSCSSWRRITSSLEDGCFAHSASFLVIDADTLLVDEWGVHFVVTWDTDSGNVISANAKLVYGIRRKKLI